MKLDRLLRAHVFTGEHLVSCPIAMPPIRTSIEHPTDD
jgi:hypothetical protein